MAGSITFAEAQSRQEPRSNPHEHLVSEAQLEKFRDEPGCSGPILNSVKTMLETGELIFGAAFRARASDALQLGQRTAQDFNRAAQAAADKGCSEAARKWWLNVIENYTGSGYAAMRQRAQIGVDDLRAAASQRSPSIIPGAPTR